MKMDIKIKMTPAYKKAHSSKARYNILYGGAGSGKSVYMAQRIIMDILKDKKYRWLCVRKVGRSIKNSVFAELLGVINENDLENLFKINQSSMEITCINGAKIITSGLDDVGKLKSIKGINRIWIEEANEVTEKDFRQLDLRMRGKKNMAGYAGFQMTMTFNPISELHWLKRVFIDIGMKNSFVLKTTYKDNPFLDEQYIRTLLELEKQDYQYYKIYCLGEWGSLGNLVYSKWVKKDLSKRSPQFDNIYNGLDWGFSNDPTAFVRIHIDKARKEIYIFKDFYMRESHIDEIATELKPIIGNETITCDSSEPRSIADLQRHSLNAVGAKKGSGSLEHGIKQIKGYNLIVDENCVDTINELSTYKMREDKDGNVLGKPLDQNNHIMDALRYSLESELTYEGSWGWNI